MEMQLLTNSTFFDFELIDSGAGFRLERWGRIVLKRPDPQIIWPAHENVSLWDGADAVFESSGERGQWKVKREFERPWTIGFDGVRLKADLTNFKHTGIFAEQAANWEWMRKHISGVKQPEILNLFAYTGAASVILAASGARVTHVDASKPAITWANFNKQLNNLSEDSIRWMLDDAAKFVRRELKRGKKYDGILMDPPAFGHSPSGKVWKFNQHLPGLLSDCVELLSDRAQFILVNGYATNSSALALQNLLQDAIAKRKGNIEFGELCLKQRDERLISTGIFARWSPETYKTV